MERPWSPLLQPEPPSRLKEKRKRGASDVSRDQVSCEGSVGSGEIEEEEEEEEEADSNDSWHHSKATHVIEHIVVPLHPCREG